MQNFFKNSLLLNATQLHLMNDLKQEIHELNQNHLKEMENRQGDVVFEAENEIEDAQFNFDYEEDFG